MRHARLGRQMVDDGGARLFRHAAHELRIGDVALTKNSAWGNVLKQSGRQIIHHPDGIARLDAGLRYMGADEACASRHQHVRHLGFSTFTGTGFAGHEVHTRPEKQ